MRQRARNARLGRTLAFYGSAGFVTLEAVELFSNQLGLPSWLFIGVLVILIAGLPVIITTALLQADPGDPAPTPAVPDAGAAPAGAAAAATPRSVGRRWFTWRNSAVGAVTAFGGLAVVVVAYVGMRSLGIGPLGSLLAAGVLEQRDPILVAAFDSPAGDTALAGVVTEAFRIDLSQSAVVALVTPQRLQQALLRMERPAETRVSAGLAREIATREGLKAFVTGEVTPLGRSFVLSARLVSAESGEVLTAVRETAADSTALIDAIDRLSKRLRERIGESLRAIRRAEPLATATTGSLEALRKYTQGARAYDLDGDYAKARTLLQDAVRIDTTFAMAWRKLAVVLFSRNVDRSLAVDAATRAYQLSDRLPDVERYLAAGTYHLQVSNDLNAAAAAYRALLDVAPGEASALNNLALIYLQTQDYANAEQLLTRSLAEDSSGYQRFINLSTAQYFLGRHDEAEQTLEAMHARFPANPIYHQTASRMAAARFDYERAEALLVELEAAHRSDALLRLNVLGSRAGLAALHGRIAEAERLAGDGINLAPPQVRPLFELQVAAQSAATRALFTGEKPDLGRVDALLADVRLDEVGAPPAQNLNLAQLFALAGRTARARELVAQWDGAARLAGTPEAEGLRAVVEGEILLQEGRLDAAIAALRGSEDAACPICALPTLARAWELTGAADSARAAWTRYVETPFLNRIDLDVIFLPLAYEQLGALSEAAGDAASARHYYGRFIALWENADPELQPRVRAARQRLSRLVNL